MVMLRPFRPLRYNSEVVGDLSKVVAPPYDVISDAHRDRLYERDPHNVIRLELGREADRYESAARHLSEWQRERVLCRDSQPSLAYYVENYRLPDGTEKERRGLFSSVRLEPFSSGRIRPHERTFSRAKEDRLKLLRATRTNLSPIFGLFAKGPDLLAPASQAASQTAPDIDLRDEYDWRHRLWFLRTEETQQRLAQALADETVYIADGHHRYETGLNYAREQNEAGADPQGAHNYILMYVTSMREPGLVVLPTHRILATLPIDASALLQQLGTHLQLVEFDRDRRDDLVRFLAASGAPAFGVVLRDSARLVAAVLANESVLQSFAPDTAAVVRRLDVSVLDAVVFRSILGIEATSAESSGMLRYSHADEEAFQAVEGGAAAAFLMAPPRLDDVVSVCQAGEVMPQKSTYFFPKLLSGLLFHSFD